jgi:hypothetical protein
MQWKTTMKRYLIERYIPGVGSLSLTQLKALAATSNDAIAKLSQRDENLQSPATEPRPNLYGLMSHAAETPLLDLS